MPDLYTGKTQAFFHSSTKIPFFNERLKIQLIDGAMIFADILRVRAGIVSRPVDFDTLRLLSSVITSCSLIARNLNNVFNLDLDYY